MGILLFAATTAGEPAATGLDGFLEKLFEQKLFLIVFGLSLYYTIIWSGARNKKAGERKIALDVADTEEEKAQVKADPKYNLSFRTWFHDQKDEILVASLTALLLIEFDDVAIELLEKYFNFTVDTHNTNWIYLTGGVLADILYRIVGKIRHG